MQQRYYEPLAGRFLSVDSVTTDAKDGSSFNRYTYVANNPFRYTDPDGMQLTACGEGATTCHSIQVGDLGASQAIAQGAQIVRSATAELSQAARGAANLGAILSNELAALATKNPFFAAMRYIGALLSEGTSGADKPAGIPDNWREEPTKGDGGRQWVNPDNAGDRVRVMPGDPDSRNPGQRDPYVRDVRNGNRWLDTAGNRVEGKSGRNSPNTHVPVKDYVFRP